MATDGDAALTGLRGAVYIPARAYNAYQLWRDYDEDVVERDLGYAETVNLNAIRIWTSYEYWLEDPEGHAERFEHLLSAAAERGIRVLPSLFEIVGEEPTEQNLTDDDPLSAYAVHSPATSVVEDPEQWDRPREFVRWFMDRWRDDDRLLAVEVHNEPDHDLDRVAFARAMLETLDEQRGSVPLTVGATSVEGNGYFLDLGVDVLQFHENFPPSAEDAADTIEEATAVADVLDRPVWMTEWQRVRPGGSGWFDDEDLAPEEVEPDLASLAPTVRESGVDGDFFWSLMAKPAYLSPQRELGTINGLFHEDGAVWDLEDARAVAGDPDLDLEERAEWPEWAAAVPREYRDGGD